jgi:RecB family endonuclease NucS
VDENGNTGQQYYTEEVGYIDLLAKNSKGNFVVIELKKGRRDDEVIGQVLRYMGWVRKNLCKKNEEVHGLIVVGERDKKLNYALEEIGVKVSAMVYQVSFKLDKF